MAKASVIIAAAGTGSRMGVGFNKQFIKLKGRPILYYTLEVFNNNSEIENIIITAKQEEINYIKENIVIKYGINKVSAVIAGGKVRQESVFNALQHIAPCDIVLIHDGARPFVTNEIIRDGIRFAKEFGAAACGVVPKDTIKVKGKDGFSEGTLRREELFCVQTPQCFKYKLIIEGHEKAVEFGNEYTDDTAVIEALNHKVYLYEGSYENIKITTSEDLVFANTIIESRS